MRLVFYVNVISPHQLPLFGELASRVGHDSVFYIYTERKDADHAGLWNVESLAVDDVLCDHIMHISDPRASKLLETSDVLLSGLRDFSLFDRRAQLGLKNLYMSEDWFKPSLGYLRLLHPKYFGYARKLVKLAKQNKIRVLPIGVHARRSFARVGVPDAAMTTWGYFVQRSSVESSRRANFDHKHALRVLWVGRLLALKRVDTLFKAAQLCLDDIPLELTVAGDGPERDRLEALAARSFQRHPDALTFMHSVSMNRVRELMRDHDVYVMPSNAYEGWGAVVSEALEEGMQVLGSHQAGATATILPETHRFKCGDCKRLAHLLKQCYFNRLPVVPIGDWSAAKAAELLLTKMI